MFPLKRSLARVGAAALVAAGLLVAACGSDDDSSSSTATSTGPAAKAEVKKLSSILFVNPLPKQEQWRLIGDCLGDQAKKLGIEYTETGPTGELNPVTMVRQIQQGIANKRGAIVTFPASPAFGPVLEQAKQAGIITGTMYGGGGSAVGVFNTGVDYGVIGRQYVEPLAEREGPQHVGVLAASATGVGKAFVDGFKAAAKEAGNVTVEGVAFTEDSPAKALDEVNALLTAHPEINAIVSPMSTATTPVVSAIKAKKLVGKVVLLTNGPGSGGVEGAKAGIVHRFLMQDLCSEGKDAANAAADIAAGKKVPAQIEVATVMAGADDYQSYLDKGWM